MTTRSGRVLRGKIPVLVVVLAALMAAGCGRGGPVEVPGTGECRSVYRITYQEYPGSTVNLWPTIAERAGFFADHCIEATGRVVNSGPAALAQLAAGDLQTMMSTPDNFVQARANGFDLRIVATAAERASLGFVVSTSHLGTRLPVDEAIGSLRGKTIGVNSQGSQMHYFAAAVLREHGVDPSEVKFVGLGTPASMLASLKRDNIQAAVFDSQFTTMVTSLGFGETYSDMRYPSTPDNPNPMPKAFEAMDGMASSYAFTDAFLDAHPDAARAWASAIADATVFARDPANRQQVRDMMRADGKVVITDATPNADQIFNAAVDAAADSSSVGARPDPALLQRWIDWTARVRGIGAPPTLDELVWRDRG